MCSEPSNDRPAVKHYESKGGPIVHFGRGSQALLEGSKIFFSAYAGMPICPRLVVSDTFEWLDANALRLELHLNSSHPLVALPLPRQPNDEAIIVDLNKWPVWDGKNWMDARFSFEKVEENALLHSSLGSNVQDYGIILIAVTRLRILEWTPDTLPLRTQLPRTEFSTMSQRPASSNKPEAGLKVVASSYQPYRSRGASLKLENCVVLGLATGSTCV
ncbi:MAG: hypothetical protein MMC23_004092 [Stictis urceolatum]|nr:hypothetical protein [Stictis urceolata]